jgi:NAD(P)H-hydrate epimerase
MRKDSELEPKTAEELKEIDHRCIWEYKIPTLLLMEHAGRGAAQVAMEMNPSRRQTLIIIGSGNNGGDGLVVARFLRLANFPVKVWLLGPASGYQKSSAPWYNHQIVKHMGIPITYLMDDSQLPELKKDISTAGLVIDAMLGIGLSGDVRQPYAAIIKMTNEFGERVLAIDVPSGLDSDTGEPKGVAVRAAKTVTFVAPKPGFETEEGREYCGEVILVDIGVPPELL